MKNYLISLILVLFAGSLFGQSQCDVYTLGIAPVGSSIVNTGSTIQYKFTVGNIGSDVTCAYPINSVKVIVSLPGDVTNGLSYNSHTAAYFDNGMAGGPQYFTWTYIPATKTFEGINTEAAIGFQDSEEVTLTLNALNAPVYPRTYFILINIINNDDPGPPAAPVYPSNVSTGNDNGQTTVTILPENKVFNVQCLVDATAPVFPGDFPVTSCTPAQPVANISETVNVCGNGQKVYSYNFINCTTGANFTWTYTYNIVQTTPPTEVPPLKPTSSIVECDASAVPPTLLPEVKDICGATLSPAAAQKRILIKNDFSQAVTTGVSQAAGVWYTDRYAPNGFSSPVAFGGGDRLLQSINSSDGANMRPGAFSGSFYNTQGRKYDLGTATDYAEIKLFVPADWATSNKRMAGFWGTGYNILNNLSNAYPIVEFSSDGGVPRFQVWTGTGGWVNIGLPSGFVYDSWITLSIRLLPTGEFLISAGDIIYQTSTYSGNNTVRLGNVILQGYNYDAAAGNNNGVPGVTYDIYWDDFIYNDQYTSPVTCEGFISYTYNYTNCSGQVFSWTYEYTVDRTTAPAEDGGPVATSGTVECDPSAPSTLPVVKDVCGNTLTAPTPVVTSTGDLTCEGTKTYTYTYTDCSGLNYVWAYTYTIDRTTAPAEDGGPVDSTSTVECLAAAVVPGVLPVIKDVCGNTLTPQMGSPVVGGTYANGLGTVTYTYNYLDCSELPFSWTYTYTVIDNTAPVFTTCPVNITGQIPNTTMCRSNVALVNPVVMENCTYTLTWTMTDATIASGSGNIPSPYAFNAGNTTVTYTAKDAAGNMSMCSFTVEVLNNVAATITGGGNTTVNAPTTANVIFTGSGGLTPYTFAYTINNGPTQYITTPGMSSTVSIAHPNSVAGTFVYKLIGVVDGYGCSGTLPVPPDDERTVNVLDAADLSPTIPGPANGNFVTTDPPREGYVQFTNGGTGATNGVVSLRISKIANFTISIPPTMTTSGAFPFTVSVDNSAWEITEGLFFYTITQKVSPPTPDIPAGGNIRIGYILTPTGPGGSTGNLTATVINGTGGDNNNNNNTAVRTFVIN